MMDCAFSTLSSNVAARASVASALQGMRTAAADAKAAAISLFEVMLRLKIATFTPLVILRGCEEIEPWRATSVAAPRLLFCPIRVPALTGVLPNCAHVEYAVSQAHGESCPPVDRFGCARQSPVFAA